MEAHIQPLEPKIPNLILHLVFQNKIYRRSTRYSQGSKTGGLQYPPHIFFWSRPFLGNYALLHYIYRVQNVFCYHICDIFSIINGFKRFLIYLGFDIIIGKKN